MRLDEREEAFDFSPPKVLSDKTAVPCLYYFISRAAKL